MIEDDEYKASRIKKQLKSEDTVRIRSDFKSGLSYLRCNTDKIGCVILDMQFPNKRGGSVMPTGGKEFLEVVKRENINIPIVLYTGCNKEEIAKLDIEKNVLMTIHFDPSYSIESDVEEMYSLLEGVS